MRRCRSGMLLLVAIGAAAWLWSGPDAPVDVMLRCDDIPLAELTQVPAARWHALAGMRVYFGHRSVGEDILAGIEAIRAELPQITLRIVPGEPAVLQHGPALAHAAIGDNGDPASKLLAFTRQLATAPADDLDIALMKFCYVDVGIGTDVDKLFDGYRQAVTRWRASLPRTRFVHCTVPLCLPPDTWKQRLQSRFGRGEVAANRRREAWNQKLRAEYGGREPVFDIATAEATLPDGTRVTAGGVPCLAACYTNDGGHLNPVGRRAVGRALLLVLAELADGTRPR